MLGGSVEPEKEDAAYQKMKEIDVAPEDQKQIAIHPISGRELPVAMHPRNSTDERLAGVLLDPQATRERKDSAMAMALFEMGKESASFLADLYLSRGALTKETHQFKSQMRFDFEMFVNGFTLFLNQTAHSITDAFLPTKETEEILGEVENELEGSSAGKGTMEALKKLYDISDQTQLVLLDLGLRFYSEAEHLKEGVRKITENRMREAGYGIYIDKHGKIYSVFDSELEAAIESDKGRAKKEKEDARENTSG